MLLFFTKTLKKIKLSALDAHPIHHYSPEVFTSGKNYPYAFLPLTHFISSFFFFAMVIFYLQNLSKSLITEINSFPVLLESINLSHSLQSLASYFVNPKPYSLSPQPDRSSPRCLQALSLKNKDGAIPVPCVRSQTKPALHTLLAQGTEGSAFLNHSPFRPIPTSSSYLSFRPRRLFIFSYFTGTVAIAPSQELGDTSP